MLYFWVPFCWHYHDRSRACCSSCPSYHFYTTTHFFVMEIKHKNRCSFFPNINTRLNNIHTSSLFKTLIAHSPTLTLHAGLLPSLFQITCTFGTIFHFLCVVPYPLMQQSWWRLRLCLKRTICEPRSGYSTDRT